MSLDLAPAIREALIDEVTISGLLAEYNGEPAIFTRRPVPSESLYPMIIVSPDIVINDIDALVSRRPVVIRDVTVYGNQPDDYRTIEQIGYSIRQLFHRQRLSITPTGYSVVDIIATGPNPAPTDDQKTVARVVTLTITTRETP